MSGTVTIFGFVGLHPYVAYTPKGVKVLVFSLGSRWGHHSEYRQVIMQGELAEHFQTQLAPGQQVMVTGEVKTKEGKQFSYFWAHDIQILSNQPQLTFDFAA